MAYGLIHTSAQRDRHNILWTNRILRRDYTGAEGDALVGAGADPLRLEFLNRSDDIFDPIKASRLVITVWSNAMFKFYQLYSADKKYHQVETLQGASLYWKGYVDPSQYKEKYGPVPYEFQIAAVDGLTLLQDIRYEASEGVPYNGMKLASEIILDILGKIDHTSFTEFINIYALQMADTVNDSPLDQMKINTDVFKDKYCDEVLEQILGVFNANIRMIAGAFVIFTPLALLSETVYGRTFTGPTTKSSVNITPLQYIKRPGHTTAMRQVQPSVASALSPARKVIIKQDYGNKESWVDNWDFKAETIDRTAGTVESWEWSNGTYKDFYPMSSVMASEKTGIALGTTASMQQVLLTQAFGEALQSFTDQFTLEFQFGWYNNLGTSYNSMVNIYVEITCGSYYLKDADGTMAEWTTTPSGLMIFPHEVTGTSTVPPGFTGWFTFTRSIISISAGTLNIKISSQAVPNTYSCVKDLKFYVSSFRVLNKITPGLKPVGPVRRSRPSTMSRPKTNYEPVSKVEREYSTTNDITGDEQEYEFLIGDVSDTMITNVLGQFQGALAAWIGGALSRTASWHTRGATENLPLLQLICNQRAALLAKPRQFVDMAIMEEIKAETAISLIGNFQDAINASDGYLRAFFANRGTFHIKYRTWQLDLIELGRGQASGSAPPGDITVDTTQTTVDSTTITTDQT